MLIKSGLNTYKWIDDWAKIPDTPGGRENGRTHSVVASRTGNIIICHQASPFILVYDNDGTLLSSWGHFPGVHGMTLVEENDMEYLWLTDEVSSRVVKMSLDGVEIMSLSQPDHPAYVNGQRYVPTWEAQNPETGEVWVADGYGASLVHSFSPAGKYQRSIDGTEGAGRFSQPHGINFRRDTHGPELFITDRMNRRIVVYDGSGNFRRASMSAHSPCCFDFLGDRIVIPELFTGVKILDYNSLELVDEIGASDRVGIAPNGAWWPPVAPEAWPNLAGTEHIRPGFFSSPHGACFAPNGDIYAVEWIVGGRITKLEKQ